MSNKSVLDVQVNSESFTEFFKLFTEFQTRVGDIPAGIGKIGTEAKGRAVDFALISAQAHKLSVETGKIAIELQKAGIAQDSFNRKTKGSAQSMKELAHHSSSMWKTIAAIGMRGGAAAAIAATVIAFGDKASDYMVGGQRKARGIGLNQGQQRAFGLDFKRYIDPSSLNAAAASQADLTGRKWLSMASGVSYQQAGTMGVDQLVIKAALNAHDWWAKTPAAMRSSNMPMAQAFASAGFGMEDLRRLGATPRSDLEAAQGQYGRNKDYLHISDKKVSSMYDLSRHTEREIMHAAAVAATAAGSTASVINTVTGAIGRFGTAIDSLTSKILHPGSPSSSGKILNYADIQAKSAALEKANGLPPGWLNAVMGVETSHGKNIKTSVSGAQGLMQLMPSMSRHFGVDPNDPYQALGAAAKLSGQDSVRYHGDLRKMAAAYNTGDTNLDAAIKRYGNDWERHLLPQTRNYIPKLIGGLPHPNVTVQIVNKTGADMSVTSNALSH